MKYSNDEPGNWIEYWNQDNFWAHSKLWRINAELFFRRAAPIIRFRKTDSVLNVGCGPGYLERHLAPLVETIDALDTSEQFVRLCQKNCEQHPNVTVKLLGKNYTDSDLFGRRFSLFLAVSVVQYYRSMSEVEALIHSARKVALPGARMLIADLPQKRNALGFARDAWSSLFLSLREGYLPVLLHTAWTQDSSKSTYQSFRKRVEELHFSNQEIQSLVRRMKLDATIIRENLSVYANRPSLLIRF